MQRLVDIDIDPDFKIHTCYYNNFFLLRTKVLVDGRSTEIRPVKQGSYEEPALSFCYSGSTITTKLWPITNTFSPIFQQCGVYHIDTFYYEQSPLFHVVFSSESCLKKFLSEIDWLKRTMEVELLSVFSECLKAAPAFKARSSPSLAIEVQAELFLVIPNRQKVKGAQLLSVTTENCSNLLANWKDSELFEFASLYREKAGPPKITSQPMSQNDIPQGNPLSLTIRATGKEPLSYQWQWKPAGKEDEQHKWQDLSCDGTAFREMEAGLELAGVQACHAGDYRCVVSNSAGSEISQCASLTVAEPPKISSHPMSQKDVLKGSQLGFEIRVTGTQPLSYQWQWKPAGKEDEQHQWQNLSCDGTTFQEVEGGLKLAGVQPCHMGDYRCVVSNSAGTEISQCASITVAELPKITSHPMGQKDVLKGSPLGFRIRATGSEPLSYQWQWKPAGKADEQHQWQDLYCDHTTFQEVEGGLKLTDVQACHAGDYRCVVSNSAGSEISQCASLTVGHFMAELSMATRTHDEIRKLSYIKLRFHLVDALGADFSRSTLDTLEQRQVSGELLLKMSDDELREIAAHPGDWMALKRYLKSIKLDKATMIESLLHVEIFTSPNPKLNADDIQREITKAVDSHTTSNWTVAVGIFTGQEHSPQSLAIVKISSSQEKNAESERAVEVASDTLQDFFPSAGITKIRVLPEYSSSSNSCIVL